MISSFRATNTYYEPSLGELGVFVYNLLWWLVLISLSVALVNMLPMGIFDGGRFFYLTVLGITKNEKLSQKIPLRENFIYVLALLRTKDLAHIQVAKEMLKKLICFDVAGNFPTYLHEYPVITSPYQGLYIAGVLYWILKEYPIALGSELVSVVRDLFQRLLVQEGELPFGPKVIHRALTTGTIGSDWDLEGLSASKAFDFMLAMQIAEQTDPALYLQKIGAFWDPEFSCYHDPKNLQWEGSSLQRSPLDLYFFQWIGAENFSVLEPHPSDLLGSLIFPFRGIRKEEDGSGKQLFCEKKEGRGSFSLLWKESGKTFSLTIKAKELFWKEQEGGIQVFFLHLFDGHIELIVHTL